MDSAKRNKEAKKEEDELLAKMAEFEAEKKRVRKEIEIVRQKMNEIEGN